MILPLSRRRLLAAGALAPALWPGGELLADPFRQSPVDPAQMLVAFGHVGPISDGGWTHAHDVGVQAVRARWPQINTLYVENVPYSADATRIFRQFVAEGAGMVIATSGYGDFIRDVADSAPSVAFLECDGQSVTGNLGWYYLAHWYASYVIGVAAGRLSKTGRLGYVASFPIPSVFAGANATLLGAQSVNPAATMRVISINSWFDPQAASQAGAALIDNGCDFLCGIMDDPAYLRVAEERHVWAAMWNTDSRRFGPDSYVSSVVLDFGPFYIDQIAARLAGHWRPAGHFLPLGHGVDRDIWGARVPAAVAGEADAVRTRILSGWTPFRGPIRDTTGRVRVPDGQVMNDDALYHWSWQVQGGHGLG